MIRTAAEGGGVTTQSAQRTKAPRNERQPELIVVCAWCKQRERDGDSWVARRSQLRDDELSHGICPVCLERELRRLKE